MLVVEIIERDLWAKTPGKQRDLERSLAHSFIRGRQIEVAHTLEPCVGKPGRSVIAVHARIVSGENGERRHYARLLVHADIGLNFVCFHLRIQQRLQGLQRAESIPQPVVDIEGTRILMDL